MRSSNMGLEQSRGFPSLLLSLPSSALKTLGLRPEGRRNMYIVVCLTFCSEVLLLTGYHFRTVDGNDPQWGVYTEVRCKMHHWVH